jgi:type IV pilus assembly protein PilQ
MFRVKSTIAGFLACVVAAVLAPAGPAQEAAPAASAPEPVAASARVTLNIEEGDIQQVLTAFSRQTGRNIVIGPDVRGPVNVRVTDVSWQTALEVILRPYGFTYEIVEDAVIVMKQDASKPATTGAAAAAAPPPPPPEVKVFTLKFLDASDIEEVVKAQLGPQGSVVVLRPLGQFWEPESSSGGGGGANMSKSGPDTALARGRRTQESKEVVRSKRFIVRDTAETLKVVGDLVAQLDIQPEQVLIEARFVEVSSNFARDVGFELNAGSTFLNGSQVQRLSGQSGTLQVQPRVVPADAPYSSSSPFNTGGTLFFQQLTDIQFSVLMHMLEDDRSANILSSPRIMTLNNQEARIIIGEKFPIVEVSSVPTTTGIEKTITLDYYEKIGIQLAVVPQICASNRIGMIVRPSVTSRTSLVEDIYPVLSTREAETQIMLASGDTVVIGGLVKDEDRSEQYRVPFLGQIPLIGRLFRRDAGTKDKIDLLIFLTATIHGPDTGAEPAAR